MNPNNSPSDLLDSLQEELRQDGTHPAFPVQKFFAGEDWSQIPWSELAFDLPALVVYGQREHGSRPVVGVVIALSHQLGRTQILVQSKDNGKMVCHPIEKSPSGLKPSHLLLKRHLPMSGLP